MAEPASLQDRLARIERWGIMHQLFDLDLRLFRLESALNRLEWEFRCAEEMNLPRLRKRRSEIRYQFELFKIDFEGVKRHALPFMND